MRGLRSQERVTNAAPSSVHGSSETRKAAWYQSGNLVHIQMCTGMKSRTSRTPRIHDARALPRAIHAVVAPAATLDAAPRSKRETSIARVNVTRVAVAPPGG